MGKISGWISQSGAGVIRCLSYAILPSLLVACAPSIKEVSQEKRPFNPKIPITSGACEAGETPAYGVINGTPIHTNFALSKSVVRIYSRRFDTTAGQWRQDSCTASILDRHTILTAAHCVSAAASHRDVLVHFHPDPECEANGPMNPRRTSQWASLDNVRTVQSFAVHAGYNQKYYMNDLALIRLDQEIPADYKPARFANWSALETKARERVMVVGYGAITHFPKNKDDIDPNQRLRFGWVRPLTPGYRENRVIANMREQGMSAEQEAFVPQRWIFFDQSDENGICVGDSGGPSFAMVNGQWMQVGVASFVVAPDISAPENCRDVGAQVQLGAYWDWLDNTSEKLKSLTGRHEL